LIVEGRLVDALDGVRHGQVELAGDRIVRVGDGLGRASLSFDDRHLIFPGFGDIHVHLRWGEEHKEDFDTATAAALNGGVTFMLDMPNNPRPPVDAAGIAEKRAACGDRPVDIDFYAAVVPGAKPIPSHRHYKAYLGPTTGSLFYENKDDLERTLAGYSGCRIAFHCEDPTVLWSCVDAPTHEERRPSIAELQSGMEILGWSVRLGFRPHIAHVSSPVLARLLLDSTATTEVTPHHLYFDAESRKQAARNQFLKMNPPLRSPEEREQLLRLFLVGGIQMLATDHAPHTVDEKATTNPSGVPHLDTYGGFVAWLLQRGMSPEAAALRCCYLPGRFYGIPSPLIGKTHAESVVGRIAPGYKAHLAILRLDQPWTVRAEDLRTKCAWSPFEGETLPGRVELTIASGRLFKGGYEVT